MTKEDFSQEYSWLIFSKLMQYHINRMIWVNDKTSMIIFIDAQKKFDKI